MNRFYVLNRSPFLQTLKPPTEALMLAACPKVRGNVAGSEAVPGSQPFPPVGARTPLSFLSDDTARSPARSVASTSLSHMPEINANAAVRIHRCGHALCFVFIHLKEFSHFPFDFPLFFGSVLFNFDIFVNFPSLLFN